MIGQMMKTTIFSCNSVKMDVIEPPTDEAYMEIFQNFSDISTCQQPMQWTVWKSASNASNGNDFELLVDHINFFGYDKHYIV